MTRLIDADKLLKSYGLETATKYPIGDGHGYDTLMLYEIRDMIENAPTVDAVPLNEVFKDGKHNFVPLVPVIRIWAVEIFDPVVNLTCISKLLKGLS